MLFIPLDSKVKHFDYVANHFLIPTGTLHFYVNEHNAKGHQMTDKFQNQSSV